MRAKVHSEEGVAQVAQAGAAIATPQCGADLDAIPQPAQCVSQVGHGEWGAALGSVFPRQPHVHQQLQQRAAVRSGVNWPA